MRFDAWSYQIRLTCAVARPTSASRAENDAFNLVKLS